MSQFQAKMHQILFPASVRSSVRLDGVWHLQTVNACTEDCIVYSRHSGQIAWWSKQMSGVLSKDQHCVLTVLHDVFDCLFTNAVIVWLGRWFSYW